MSGKGDTLAYKRWGVWQAKVGSLVDKLPTFGTLSAGVLIISLLY